MLDSIRLKCPFCNAKFSQSVAYVQGQIKAMKIGKVGEVVQQLKEKRGPFYDRWKVAMDLRGEQKRCKTCLAYQFREVGWPDNYCSYYLKFVNSGRFACKRYIQFDRD